MKFNWEVNGELSNCENLVFVFMRIDFSIRPKGILQGTFKNDFLHDE